MLTHVQFNIEDNFSNHEDKEQRDRRTERHCQKAARQKRDMQYDNSRIGLAHQNAWFCGFVFSFEEVIMDERYAVTNEQGEDCVSHLRRDCREHLPYNINQ